MQCFCIESNDEHFECLKGFLLFNVVFVLLLISQMERTWKTCSMIGDTRRRDWGHLNPIQRQLTQKTERKKNKKKSKNN